MATDLRTRASVLLTRGDLARAVRASMSIPLVFYPQRIDGRPLVDGGIVDNIPTAPARLRASSLTVVDISSEAADSVDINSMAAIASQLYELFLRETGDTVRADELFVRPDITGIGLLDFAPETMTLAEQRGAEAARLKARNWSCRPAARPHLLVPSGPFRLASVTIDAPRASERAFLQREFGLVPGDTLNLARIRDAYHAMELAAERREIWLNPSRTDSGLHLDMALTPPPVRKAGFGLAFDYDMGGRLSGAFVDNALFGHPVNGSMAFALGRYQQSLVLGARPQPASWNPLQPDVRVTLQHEDVRNYDLGGLELLSSDTHDYSGTLSLQQVSERWVVRAGAVGGTWTDSSGTVNAAGAQLHVTTGNERHRPTLTLDAATTNAWSRALLDGEVAAALGRWSFSAAARAGAGDQLPQQLALRLGGSRGFPGYYVYELRGDRELFGELAVDHRLVGPLRARAEFAGGRMWHSQVDDELGGVRLSTVLGTPVGELQFGYGGATTGRRSVFARLGAWF
jgi:hypothetical protein